MFKFSPSATPLRPNYLNHRSAAQLRNVSAAASGSSLGLASQPVEGRELQTMASWLSSRKPQKLSEAAGQLQVESDRMGEWVFQGLKSPQATQNQSSADFNTVCMPSELLIGVLGPLAGHDPRDPDSKAAQLIRAATAKGDPQSLSKMELELVLTRLVGDDVQVHRQPDHMIFPGTRSGLRAWAALSNDGSIWFSKGNWMDGGAFKINTPAANRAMIANEFNLSWDAQLRDCSLTPLADLQFFTWPALDQAPPPIANRGRVMEKSVFELLRNKNYAVANLAFSPTQTSWPNPVSVEFGRVIGESLLSHRASSDLLSHSEAWLAGVRFERLFPSSGSTRSGWHGSGVFAQQLLSLINTSIASCPTEERMSSMLMAFSRRPELLAGDVRRSEEGRMLVDSMQRLIGGEFCHVSFEPREKKITSSTDRADHRQETSNGLLVSWLTENTAAPHKNELNLTGLRSIYTHQLHTYVTGPAFGDNSMLLSRDIRLDGGWLAGGLSVHFGPVIPESAKRHPRLVALVDPELSEDMLDDMEARASSQAQHWQLMLGLRTDI